MTDAKILVVEDDASGVEECLKNLGYTVCTADAQPDLALVNLCLEGLKVAEKIDVPVVYLADKAAGDLLQQAQATNPYGYVLKPFEACQLHLIIQTAFAMHARENGLKEKIDRLEDFTNLMQTVLNSMEEGVVAIDENRRLMFNNASARRIGGEHPYPPEKNIDLWAETYGVYEPGGERIASIKNSPPDLALKGQEIDAVEVFIRNDLRPEGVHVRVSSRPLIRESGVLRGAVMVFRDITKEKEAEQMKIELVRLRSELETTSGFPGLIGTSPVMQEIYELIQRAAESDITVLIRGESGTGKELVANSLHANSPRKEAPFVAVDCAAIPETLIESELFGHEIGAYTGATTQRIGAFERANGGTLFLDEIGDMPYVLQGKLLRVLQERVIQRIGGTAPIPVDIRVITATNKDPENAVRAGKFRQDLFYRISAFPVTIPPLRARREDIPLLARHFLEKFNAQAGKSINGISALALQFLLQYNWPGNVRELENAIERAVLLETTELLQASNLPSQLSSVTSENNPLTSMEVLSLTEVERQGIIFALEAKKNNVADAAQALGINRATLYRKLKKHAIVRDGIVQLSTT